nr:MAG TPA: hypothetical protein [Caudoviricetes sp.]
MRIVLSGFFGSIYICSTNHRMKKYGTAYGRNNFYFRQFPLC